MNVLDGYVRLEVTGGELWVAEGFEDAAEELGFRERSRWKALIAAGEVRGRGKISFIEHAGRGVALKQLRRGGVAAPLWRDRFSSHERLMRNLSIPRLARERGVATPAALALLAVAGPPGLWRGWLATQTVPHARDMKQRVSDGAASAAEWAAVLSVAHGLHDAGIEHPDLNLGNLLIDEAGQAWVVDLDGCKVHPESLGPDRRVDALRRVERSFLKICFLNDVDTDPAIDWPAVYAPGDAALAARWDQRADRDRAKLNRHRRTWRR